MFSYIYYQSKKTAIHEFMHALGVYHQHTRYDRDNYITVNEDNIISESAKSQFNKLSESAANVYNTPYSYESVMHYGSSVSIKSL